MLSKNYKNNVGFNLQELKPTLFWFVMHLLELMFKQMSERLFQF